MLLQNGAIVDSNPFQKMKMADFTEIDSFFVKFKHLYASGLNASLDLKADNGKATVTLSLSIGCEYTEPVCKPNLNVPLNSRDRRLKRRALQRTCTGSDSSEKTDCSLNKAEDGIVQMDSDVTEKVNESSYEPNEEEEGLESVVKMEPGFNQDESLGATEQVAIESISDSTSSVEELMETHHNEPIATSENEILVNQESPLQGSELKKPIEEVGENKVRYDTKVYVTAEFINQECQLDETDIKSLKNVLRSRDHLCRNVISKTYGPVQTYREKSGLFKHYMQFIMDVDVSQLWENPRSYIYHHLGRDTWTFSQGPL